MRKGQIWVETVIYTLIILVIIGILLSILKPAIEEKKDQAILEKSVEMMNNIDNSIENIRFYGGGNSAPVELQIQKGQLIINGQEDYILFSVKSSYMYSETNQTVLRGKINITTTDKGNGYQVELMLSYKGIINLTWNKKDAEKVFNYAPTPQKIWITNYGRNAGELMNIDLNS